MDEAMRIDPLSFIHTLRMCVVVSLHEGHEYLGRNDNIVAFLIIEMNLLASRQTEREECANSSQTIKLS